MSIIVDFRKKWEVEQSLRKWSGACNDQPNDGP